MIETEDHPPIKQQPYRTPVVHREKIAKLVEEMQQQEIIQPSSSPWASPVVLVPKKDGTDRFCIDYRRLNAVTRKDVYPLPRIDDILDTLGQWKFFSTLDLSSGFWQIELDPASRPKSAFTTYQGLYEFVRMPYGLCNAPATFQRLMQVVLAGLEWKSCFVYIDDILVASKTFNEHLSDLRQVFTRLRQANLRLKPKKCSLLHDEVCYLGHVISKQGIKPDPQKTEKIRMYPTPTDVTRVRQFLGLASYYRRFVPGFARIASPLHALTKKGVPFCWTTACEAAFCQLKELLCQAPVLAYPQFGPDKNFVLETDASGAGLGAVLSQKQADGYLHPVAYASRSLQPNEKNYCISELETLALVWAVKHFQVYLLGHQCVAFTDHSACVSLLNTPHPSAKLARWAMTIQEMNLTIKHRSGKTNTNADALSRNPIDPCQCTKTANVCSVDVEEPSEGSLSTDQMQRMKDIRNLQEKDPDLVPLVWYLEKGELPTEKEMSERIVLESARYDLIDDVLHSENPATPGRWCIVVPRVLCPSLLKEAHAGCYAGHFSEKKVYDRLRRYYWWKGMRSDVRRFCRGCLPCAARKGPRRSTRPPLQPIPVGGPFHRVGVDVLQLPLTRNGNRYVVVFLDYLTKWAEAFAVPDQQAETIARLLTEHVISRHGVPEELLSDRGTNFLSDLIAEICKVLGMKKINTSGYHPQTDGLVEKFNSTLINMIAKSCEIHAHDWDEHLAHLLFAYRVSAQESTKESPFYLLYGRDPRIPTETALSHPTSPYNVNPDDYKIELMASLTNAWKLAKDHIVKAQQSQKHYYDRKSKPTSLKVGDRVMVFMPAEVRGKNRKLVRPFHGPYRVLNLTPTNAEVRLVDHPNDASLFVALNRLRPCYTELGDGTWTGRRKRTKRHARTRSEQKCSKPKAANRSTIERDGPVTRSMARRCHVPENSELD